MNKKNKMLDEISFVIRGKIRTVDKEKAMDQLDSVLRNDVDGMVLFHIDVGNMSSYYPDGNEK